MSATWTAVTASKARHLRRSSALSSRRSYPGPGLQGSEQVSIVHLKRYQPSTVAACTASASLPQGLGGQQHHCSGSSPSAPVSVAETANMGSGPRRGSQRGGTISTSAVRISSGRRAPCARGAAGGRDRQFRRRDGRPGRDVLPQARLPAAGHRHALLRRAAGADQQRVAVVHGVGEQVPEVALAVADGDHPRVRAGRREFPRPPEALDPAPAVLLGVLPEGRVHREQAERPALRRHREPAWGEDADAALAAAADPVRPVVASRPL